MGRENNDFENEFINRNRFIQKMINARKNKGFTQLELAKKLNLNVKTIQRYEKEETPINPKHLENIIKILEIDNTKELVFSVIIKTLYNLSNRSYIEFSSMLNIPVSRLKQYINATFTLLPSDIEKINDCYNMNINYFFNKVFLDSLDLDVLTELINEDIEFGFNSQYVDGYIDTSREEQTIKFINNYLTNDDFDFIRRLKEEKEIYSTDITFENEEKNKGNTISFTISNNEKEILNFLHSLNFEFIFSDKFVEIKNEKLKIKTSIPIEVFKTFVTTLHLQIGNIAIKELKKYIDLSNNLYNFKTTEEK